MTMRLTRRDILSSSLALACATTMARADDDAPIALSALHRVAPTTAVFDIPMIDGQGGITSLARWQGKPVLVHFWATWCVPCVSELPMLDVFYAANSGTMPILPIALKSGASAQIAAFYKTRGITHLPVYVAEANDASKALGGVELAIPMTLLLNGGGHLVGRGDGSIAWQSPDAPAAFRNLARGA